MTKKKWVEDIQRILGKQLVKSIRKKNGRKTSKRFWADGCSQTRNLSQNLVKLFMAKPLLMEEASITIIITCSFWNITLKFEEFRNKERDTETSVVQASTWTFKVILLAAVQEEVALHQNYSLGNHWEPCRVSSVIIYFSKHN